MSTPSSPEEELLADLGRALQTARAVPRDFIDAGDAVFSWRAIDAELAALTYDSASTDLALTTLRAEPASLRALTFAATDLCIELEVGDNVIRGQLVPAQPGRVMVEGREGETTDTLADDVGYFVIRPVPSVPFRLRCHAPGMTSILTGWIEI